MSGGPLTLPALVILTSLDIPGGYQSSTGAGSIAQFNGVPGGDYTIKVSAAGYKSASEDVTVFGSNGSVNSFIVLKPDNGPGSEASVGPPGIPLLWESPERNSIWRWPRCGPTIRPALLPISPTF